MVEEQENNLDDIRKLYPHFTDDELIAAQETYRRYVEIMVRIYERVRREQGTDAAGKLSKGE